MSNVRCMDESAGDARRTPSKGVCEPAHIPHDGVRYKPNWPFLYYEERSKTYLNKAPIKSKYETAAEIGVATF